MLVQWLSETLHTLKKQSSEKIVGSKEVYLNELHL